MIRLNDILEKVSAYHQDADLDLIKKAYVYSAKVHQGQIRKSGERGPAFYRRAQRDSYQGAPASDRVMRALR